MKRTKRRPLLLVAAVAAGATAVLWGGTTLVAWPGLSIALGAVPGVHWRKIGVDPLSGRAAIRDLAVDGDGWHLAAATVSLPYTPWRPDLLIGSAAAADDRVTLGAVTFTSGDTTVDIPQIEARGTTLSAADIKAVLDPSSPLSLEERVARLSAASLTAPSVVVKETSTGTQPSNDLTLRDVMLSEVVRGRIGHLAIAGSSLPLPEKTGPQGLMSTGRIEASSIDLPLAVTIAKGARTDPNAPLQPIVGGVSVEGVRIANAEASFGIDRLTAGPFNGRPLLRKVDDLVKLSEEPDKAADRRLLADLSLDAAKSFALGHFELVGSSFENRKDAVSIKADRFAIDDLSSRRIGSLAFENFVLRGKDADISLKRLGVSGYDQSALIEAMLGRIADRTSTELQSVSLGSRPSADALSLLALHVEVPADRNNGNSLDGSRIVFDVPTVMMNSTTNADATVARTTAHAEMTCAIPKAQIAAALPDITRRGLDSVDLLTDYDLSFDAPKRMLSLERLALDARKLATVTITAAVDGVAPEIFQAPPKSPAMAEAVKGLRFKEMTFTLDNKGAAETFLPGLAAAAHVSVPLLKAEAKGQVAAGVLQALGSSPVADKVNAAIDRFIDDPRTIRITVRAPAGLSVAELSDATDPRSLLDRVEIDATTP